MNCATFPLRHTQRDSRVQLIGSVYFFTITYLLFLSNNKEMMFWRCMADEGFLFSFCFSWRKDWKWYNQMVRNKSLTNKQREGEWTRPWIVLKPKRGLECQAEGIMKVSRSNGKLMQPYSVALTLRSGEAPLVTLSESSFFLLLYCHSSTLLLV